MPPLLAALSSQETVVVASLPILGTIVVIMTAIITYHHRRMQRDDMEATLKMEMIERGMSADDIERVLAARIGHPSRYRRPRQQPQQEYRGTPR